MNSEWSTPPLISMLDSEILLAQSRKGIIHQHWRRGEGRDALASALDISKSQPQILKKSNSKKVVTTNYVTGSEFHKYLYLLQVGRYALYVRLLESNTYMKWKSAILNVLWWREFKFTHSIPVTEQVKFLPCPRCFSELVTMGMELDWMNTWIKMLMYRFINE